MSDIQTVIDILPDIPVGLRHGQEVPYGWKVRIHRWLGGRFGAGVYQRVNPPSESAGEPLSGTIRISLQEYQGTDTAGEKVAVLFSDKESKFTCERGITGWRCAWYDQAEVQVMPPFQSELSRDENITFLLRATAYDDNGTVIGDASRTFVNLPTYCLWDVELDRPGGIEKVINGFRVVSGTRAAVYLGDFTGTGRSGFLHVVGSNHFAAYDATGVKLWTRSNPAGVPVYNSTNACVCDINGDGKDEVIAMTGKPPEAKLEIIDGFSGATIAEIPWPGNDADPARMFHSANRGDMNYTYDAKIYIANFRGLPEPRDIVLQIGDENQVLYEVFTDSLEPLWSFDGRERMKLDGGGGSHAPKIVDVDGDGRDEMLVGTYMLRGDGTIMWMHPFSPTFAGGGDDHIDGSDVGPVGRSSRIVVAFPNNCVVADAVTGELLWQKESGHGQIAYIRKLAVDLPGNQISFSEKLEIRRLFTADGTELKSPVGNGTERDWWAGGEGMHQWPIAESRLVDWRGTGEKDTFVGSMAIDRFGRCIGVGEWVAAPLVDEQVWGSTVLMLRLNMNATRARAFSGIPIPEPRGRKLQLPSDVSNIVD
jgi:hypothetical protein